MYYTARVDLHVQVDSQQHIFLDKEKTSTLNITCNVTFIVYDYYIIIIIIIIIKT